MPKEGLFIAGTGTSVGKSYTSAFLIDFFKIAQKKKVLYYKPIQCGKPADTVLLKKLAKHKDVAYSYNLKTPSSPHFAFAKERRKFDKSVIKKFLAAAKKKYDVIIIEGAGGVRVPITMNFDMADLAKLCGFPVLLIAYPGLGTINHTLLSIDYLKSKGVEIFGFMFSQIEFTEGLDKEITLDNAKTIEKISGVPYKGAVPAVLFSR
jgi:dethiobiotin synthetase